MDGLKVFSGRANLPLATKITSHLGQPLGEVRIKDFSDDELWVKYQENIRGADVFIVQPTHSPSRNWVELFVMLDTAKRAAASRITAVIPYFGYSRQDQKDQSRAPVTAKLMANLITTAGAHGVLFLDLHAGQIQGFFDIIVNHLSARPVFLPHITRLGAERLVIVAPDVGRAKLNRDYAEKLNARLAIVEKRRTGDDDPEVMNIIGDVRGATTILIDDMITTGSTLVKAANALHVAGAKHIFAFATHGVLVQDAVLKLDQSLIEKIFITDTIDHSQSSLGSKFEVVSVASLLGEAIRRIHNNESVSSLF